MSFCTLDPNKVTAFATVIMTIATVVLSFITFATLNHQKEMFEATQRPFLIFDFVVELNSYHWRLRNEGISVARNISLKFEPDIRVGYGADRMSANSIPFFQRIPSMVPRQEFKYFVETTPQYFSSSNDPKNFKVHLSYENSIGRKYSETVELSLDETAKFPTLSASSELKEITKALVEIKKVLKTSSTKTPDRPPQGS